MGLGKLAEISAQLLSHGLDSNTPAALIENGSTPQQREFVGTVATLPALAIEHQLQSPSLIVIGKVVSLAEQLSWRDLEQAAKNQELSA
jgi:uroporphyrin-III C-methyltransferase